jgi:hypothetical protein
LCSEPPALEVAPEEPRADADEEGAHDDRDHDGGEDLGVVGAVAFYTARQGMGAVMVIENLRGGGGLTSWDRNCGACQKMGG